MKLIFTLTPGRTGSTYLAALLNQNLEHALVHHEILNYQAFGLDTPDISHLHQFNAIGNTPHVQQFWQRKFKRILEGDYATYAETSHILMKAGLVDNAIQLLKDHEVHFIILKRDLFKTLVSYHARHDFENVGNQWMWYLDPNYPRKLSPCHLYENNVIQSIRFWYVQEVMARAYYYHMMCQQFPHLHFHEVELTDLNTEKGVQSLFKALDIKPKQQPLQLPGKKNETRTTLTMTPEIEVIKKIVATAPFHPREIAESACQKEKH